MDVEDTKSVVDDDSVSSGSAPQPPTTSLVQNTPPSAISVKMLIDNWFTMYYYYLHWKALHEGHRDLGNWRLRPQPSAALPYAQPAPLTWNAPPPPKAKQLRNGAGRRRKDAPKRSNITIRHSTTDSPARDLLRKQSFRVNAPRSWPARKHPVQLLCELYGKNGLQIECEFLQQPPFRQQRVTYTLLGRKFVAVSHTRDEAKRLCARRALLALHPELADQLQEQVPRQQYDFGYRLNRRHPVDLVNYFFKSEPVLIETEKRGLSHFTKYTVSYLLRGRRYVATAEKQNEAKRRCALLVLNDLWRNSWSPAGY